MTKVMNSQNWHNTFSAAASVAPIVLWSAHSQGAGNVYLASKNTFLEFYTDEKKAVRRSAATRSWSCDSWFKTERSNGPSSNGQPTTRSPSASNRSARSSEGNAMQSPGNTPRSYQVEGSYPVTVPSPHHALSSPAMMQTGTMPSVNEQSSSAWTSVMRPYVNAREPPSWMPSLRSAPPTAPAVFQGLLPPAPAPAPPPACPPPAYPPSRFKEEDLRTIPLVHGSAEDELRTTPYVQEDMVHTKIERRPSSVMLMQPEPQVVKPRIKQELASPKRQELASPKKQHSQELQAEPVDEISTLMMRGIPCNFSQDTIMRIIDQAGFKGKYDFFYLPRAGSNGTNLGYAFINFVNQAIAEQCMNRFNGVPLDDKRNSKICTIAQADIQGLANLRKHFRKTAVGRGLRGPVFLKVFTEEENQQ